MPKDISEGIFFNLILPNFLLISKICLISEPKYNHDNGFRMPSVENFLHLEWSLFYIF